MPRQTVEGMLVAVSLLGLLSCAKPPPPGSPDEAYASFAKAVRAGEANEAYRWLSQPTREAIERQAQALAKASDGGVGADPQRLAFAPTRGAALTGVRVVNQEGDVASLEVTAAGVTQRVRVVKEQGAWRVDLSESFAK